MNRPIQGHKLIGGFAMNIKINSVRFDADVKLVNYIKSKVKKLYLHYDNIIGIEVFLKLDNTPAMENKITEIRLDIPGNELFAKKAGKTFEESTDLVVDALRRQVTKHKEKVRGV